MPTALSGSADYVNLYQAQPRSHSAINIARSTMATPACSPWRSASGAHCTAARFCVRARWAGVPLAFRADCVAVRAEGAPPLRAAEGCRTSVRAAAEPSRRSHWAVSLRVVIPSIAGTCSHFQGANSTHRGRHQLSASDPKQPPPAAARQSARRPRLRPDARAARRGRCALGHRCRRRRRRALAEACGGGGPESVGAACLSSNRVQCATPSAPVLSSVSITAAAADDEL